MMTSASDGRSTAPTPFAGYSFHVAEAALVFANEVTVVFLFPIHAGLHRVYHLATTAIHIGALAEACATCSAWALAGRAVAVRQSCMTCDRIVGSCAVGMHGPCWRRHDCNGLDRALATMPAHMATCSSFVQKSPETHRMRCAAGGHAGYEIAPLIPSAEQLLWTLGHLAVGKSPGPASDLNVVADHDRHHRFPRTHFSLYFRHWDAWCGTGMRRKGRQE